MKRISDVVRPIIWLTGKNVPFEWTEECQNSFETPNKRLKTAPVLAFPDLNKSVIMHSDDSYCCITAVLSQECEIEGKIIERPKTYIA